jgi:hypothetical protein
MLASGRIALVLIEVGFTPGDERHAWLENVWRYLQPSGFWLDGVYGQKPEWSGEERLGFGNALFVNEAVRGAG